MFNPFLFAYLYTIAILHNFISDFQKYNLLLLNLYSYVLYYFIYIFVSQINFRYTQIKAVVWNQITELWLARVMLEMYARNQLYIVH